MTVIAPATKVPVRLMMSGVSYPYVLNHGVLLIALLGEPSNCYGSASLFARHAARAGAAVS